MRPTKIWFRSANSPQDHKVLFVIPILYLHFGVNTWFDSNLQNIFVASLLSLIFKNHGFNDLLLLTSHAEFYFLCVTFPIIKPFL